MSYIPSKLSSVDISIMTGIRFEIFTPISSNKCYACHEFQIMNSCSQPASQRHQGSKFNTTLSKHQKI